MYISDLYHLITATPFEKSETYMEILPCKALMPYIRCFWGTIHPVRFSDFPSNKV